MPGVDAAIDALIARVDEATRQAVKDAVARVEAKAKTLAPVKTGRLRGSILPTPVTRVSAHMYAARVGPTVVYGRQKELGGHIYPVRARALRFIARDGALVFAQHVYQHPQPFLKPAVQATDVRSVFVHRLRDAILS